MVINGVVPLRMKLVASKPYLTHRILFNLDPFGVRPGVEHSLDAQTGPGLGGTDQIDRGFVVHQRLATPVDGDERE